MANCLFQFIHYGSFNWGTIFRAEYVFIEGNRYTDFDLVRELFAAPIFFEETTDSKHYCSILHDFTGLLEKDKINYSWFQQVGTTVHTTDLWNFG